MAQTNRQTDKQAYGQRDLETESAQWAHSVKTLEHLLLSETPTASNVGVIKYCPKITHTKNYELAVWIFIGFRKILF